MSLYLVRHASAGSRTLPPADIERPIDDEGEAQAERLCDMLAPLLIDQILSSPARRCIQSVQPLATKLGLHIERSDALYEDQPVPPALSLLRRLAAAESSAVLCTHGDLIPLLLDALALDGVPLAGNGCAKASIWMLAVTDGRISDGRYLGAV